MKRNLEDSDAISSQRGFTLVELLVAMGLSAVVMAAVYSAYRSQQQSYIKQDLVAAAQQNLRAAMYVMTKDIRMAGFDPTDLTNSSNAFGITDARGDTLTFTSDLDGSGGAPGGGETITYSLNGNILERDDGGGNQDVAENIVAVGFAYSYDEANDGLADISAGGFTVWAVDSDGDGDLDTSIDTNDDGVIDASDDSNGDNMIEGSALATPVPVADIKSVRIWLLARSAKTVPNYNDNNTYVVGNSVITPTAGFMYRLLSETSRCRNL